MAEQTTSSIVIDAAPAAVMDVIADFAAYPEWAKGVKEADGALESCADGRADEVFFELDVAPIKDDYTLAYDWDGDREVTWTLVEGKMLRALDGAYVLRRPRRRLHRGDLPAGPRRVDPDDRHAQAQGREDHHRHRAEGTEEARRVARLTRGRRWCGSSCSPARAASASRRVAAGTAALAAAPATARWCCPPTPRTRSADAFGVPVGPEPTEVADRLCVQQVDAQRRFEQSWAEIQGYLLSVLDVAGVDPVAAEELTVIPGAEEVLALLELRLHALSGEWDVVVVDCAPTAETLRLLALPEALGWYMRAGAPGRAPRGQGAASRCSTRAAGVPMPEDSVFDAVERLHAELDEVRALLTGPDASVRLVLTPETVVLAEARRSLTTLSLFGYRVDGVVANRVFPDRGRRRLARGLGAGAGRGARRGRPSRSPGCRVALGVPPGRAGRACDALTDARRARCTAATTRSPYRQGEGPFRIDPHRRGRCCAWRCRCRRVPTSTWPATATSWW